MAKEEFLKPYRIAEIVRAEIRELSTHDVIPTERQMAERFGVSRVTVQKALALLESDGMIYRRHGSGSFVSPLRESRTLQLRSFTEEMAIRGESIKARIIDFSRFDDERRKTEGWSAHNGNTYRIERLRLSNEEPLAWDITHISESAAPGLENYDLSGSLYEVLEDKYNLIIESADESISPIISNGEIHKVLRLEKGTPALQLIRIGFNNKGEIVESTRSIRRADQWQFKYTVRR
jgi:GntR family transcriptional regulator